MEDLTKNWNNLSLSEKEDTGDGSRGSYLQATLEICKWFQRPKFGRSYSAFCFDNSSDVERIFQNQPWSFDFWLLIMAYLFIFHFCRFADEVHPSLSEESRLIFCLSVTKKVGFHPSSLRQQKFLSLPWRRVCLFVIVFSWVTKCVSRACWLSFYCVGF